MCKMPWCSQQAVPHGADLTGKDKFPDRKTFDWRDGFVFTSTVGSFKPNPRGLYDMTGVAWEWCSDVYGDYPAGAVTDPIGPEQH
jgi:formylglycine-generating enzyme required for sulfatase activity